MADEDVSKNISSQRISSGVVEAQPIGPTLIDDGGCTCALQEQLSTEAWRCLANMTTNIYSGQTGKWFFALNQTDPASLLDLPNSDSNPPNVTTSYAIKDFGNKAQFVAITSSNEPADLGDVTCSGKNDTKASTAFYKYAASSGIESLSPCWQPGITPLTIQNASEWNATGCNLGFFCKCTSPCAWSSLETDADHSTNRRSEQHSRTSTNLLSAFSPCSRSQANGENYPSHGSL